MEDVILWREAAAEVSELILRYPERESNPWLKNYPHGSCSVSSYAIGRLLLERHGELWLLKSGSSSFGSHTWLVRYNTPDRPAAIDATLHQFKDIATEPFIGLGLSPAEEHFPSRSPVHVGLANNCWHHRETEEIYHWLFPRLGLSSFDPNCGPHQFMPEEIMNPPARVLIDEMIKAAEYAQPSVTFAIALNSPNSASLKLVSDATFGIHDRHHGEYCGRKIIELGEIESDLALLIPSGSDSLKDSDHLIIGSIRSGKFESVEKGELENFDESRLI